MEHRTLHAPANGPRRLAPPDDPDLLARSADPATGLLGREALLDILAARIAEIGRDTFGFALLVLDAEKLASAAGPGGAALLDGIAGRLRGHVRSADVAAQLAPSRFAVLSPGPMTTPEAERLACRLGSALRAGAARGDWLVGIALYPEDVWEAPMLLRRAEGTLRAMPDPRPWRPAPYRQPRPGLGQDALALYPVG